MILSLIRSHRPFTGGISAGSILNRCRSIYQALCRERPEDINLPFAAAESDKEVTLFEVPETGLSSVKFELVQSEETTGRAVVERKIQALALNTILEKHANETIHFLKIDVEGFEEEVIRGLNLSKWRPWIIVIEATLPNSSVVNFASWEPMLLSAAYIFVYFDGLNQFYVSKEHSELAASFAAPPNFFDHFVSAEQVRITQRLGQQVSLINELKEKQKDFEFNGMN